MCVEFFSNAFLCHVWDFATNLFVFFVDLTSHNWLSSHANFLKYCIELNFFASFLNFFNDGIFLSSVLCLLVNILLYFKEAKYVLVLHIRISFMFWSSVWTFNDKCVIHYFHCTICVKLTMASEWFKLFIAIGRSNVGKSSLLNALTRQWGVVRTSDKPGLTQVKANFDLNVLMSWICYM